MNLPRDRFWRILCGIGAVTVCVGFVELTFPDKTLDLVAVNASETSKYLLAVVGLMTGTFGLMLLYALASATPQHVAILWSGVQKCSVAALVGLGIQRGILSHAAIVLASFDLVSGAMIIGYWYWVRQMTREIE
jgi:hypothetical protein